MQRQLIDVKRFRNVLLIADRHEQSNAFFDWAVTFIKTNRARLTVLDVLQIPPPEMLMQLEAFNPQELQERVVNQRLMELQQLITPFQADGYRIAVKVLLGTPFLEIIREVLLNGHDLVIKAAAHKSGAKTMLFGSTDLHLLRKCPCPVWIGRPGQVGRYARILAAVDPDPFNQERDALNLKIMDVASGLAKLKGSELYVVHAWEFYGESLLRGFRSTLSDAEVDQLIGTTLNNHLLWSEGLLKKCDLQGIRLSRHLLRGQAGEVIPILASEKQIDLIVMGTVSRTGIPGLIIGNTAEEVLDQVDCSVVVLKPDGFVTPVTLKT